MSENLKRFPGFIGPSQETRSQRFSCDRTINLVLELSKLGAGKGQEPAYLYSAPGLVSVLTVGVGPIRALYSVSNQELLIIVSGNEVYQIQNLLGTPVLIGTLDTAKGLVSIVDNGIQVMMVDGVSGYYVTLGEETLHKIVDPNFYPSDLVSYQDGYFILNRKGTQYFFLSDLYSVDFPELNAAAKAGASDLLVAAFSNNRELFLLGTNTLETWYNAGASGITPFVRQNGRFSQVGCLSPGSIARLGESFYWVGTTVQGEGVIFSLENGAPKRVSNHAIELKLQAEPRLRESIGYSYLQEGHLFYLLNIPDCDTTLCYDLSTDQWSERQSIIEGQHSRHLGQVHALYQSRQLVGDFRNGKVYEFDLSTHTDAGTSRLKLRQAPHLSDTGKNLFLRALEIDAQVGVGNSQEVSPSLSLQISRDGGKNFDNEMQTTLGKVGEYRNRIRFQRLGYGRDLVFKVYTTDSVDVTLLSAWIDVESGRG